MARHITRRRLMATGAAAALGLGTQALAASDPVELEWDDLVPNEGMGVLYGTMRDLGIVEHGEIMGIIDQQTMSEVTTAYNGKTVRLPGYVVPLDYGPDGTKEFLLVPYVGACIHVPPPPPNQIVFVTAREPYPLKDYFDAVYVTGMMTTMAVSTDLAEMGYAIRAERIEPYE